MIFMPQEILKENNNNGVILNKENIGETPENLEMRLRKIKSVITKNMHRIARLGEWPKEIPPRSLLWRVPTIAKNAAGFDAGIACALDLIPCDKQEFSARLHANYSTDLMAEARKQFVSGDSESPAIWWLSASSLCRAKGVDTKKFLQQIENFKKISKDPELRKRNAEREYKRTISSYVIKDGAPYGERDGCIQGAYLDGYLYASFYNKDLDIYFIGTCEPSLGLEDFKWSDERDEDGLVKSGPVAYSKQFVKCANEKEWREALEIVKNRLSLKILK